MKGIRKIIATAMLAAMTVSFAACGEPTAEEKNNSNTSAGTFQTAQISDGSSENPESSVSENTEIELSNPQSETESSNPESEISSKSESQTSNQNANSDGTQTSKLAEASQTSKPTTSNQTSSKPTEVSQTSNTSSNQNTNSKPAETSQTSKPATSNQNTNSNGTQTSKPTEVFQTSKPTTSNNTQTSKPTETSQVSKPATKPSVQNVTLNKTSLTLTVGQKSKLTYSISPSNAETGKITWSWSDSKVVSVSSDGTVTAKAAGKATVTIKTSNGKSATCQVTVKAKQQTSTSDNTSSQPSKPMTEEEKIAAAFQAPYEGKITGWQDTVIKYLREVGEKQYNMTWEESFYVRNRGNDYNCAFNFPESTFDRSNGEKFREDCLYLFEELKSQMARNGEDIADGYTSFKIVIEDLGVDKYRDEHEFFVYLLYG